MADKWPEKWIMYPDHNQNWVRDMWKAHIDQLASEQEFKDQYMGSWKPCTNYCKKTGTCKSPFDNKGLCECGAIYQKKPCRR